MDKKQNHHRSSSQTPTKGFGSVESKKGQDVTSKAVPRYGGKRREPTGPFAIKNEPSKKPSAQRNRNTNDKRPRPRGQYYSGAENSGLTLPEDGLDGPQELESIYLPGSKKKNINHLLNFSYGYDFNERNRAPVLPNRRQQHCYKHKYSKEEFLQATCQFVVNSNGDYDIHLQNPDVLVNWDLIEEVHVLETEFSRCPICLDLPVAPKMTRCGHVYCWHCILNYFSLSDEPSRTCPICFDSIRKVDLKSAIAKPFSNVNVGDVIRMKLMRRERNSLIVTPVDEIHLRNTNLLHVSESSLSTSFSKLLLANDADVLGIIEREKMDLLRELANDEFCPKTCFIQEALELLSVRENDILNKLGSPEKIDVKMDPNIGNTKFHYFYQASNGQLIFMHNINIRMLEQMYGSLENSPHEVEAKVIEKETDSITEELRKRMRYLQHLPVTCQIEVAELEFKSPLVTPEILNLFKDQIEHRRKRRQKRARDERLHVKRVTEKENRLMGKYPTPNIHIESLNQFPSFGSWPGVENFSPGSFDEIFPVGASNSSLLDESMEHLTLDNNPTKPSGPSFANMLTKSKKDDFWPQLDAKPKLTLVTPKAGKSQVGFELKKKTASFNLSESEDPEDCIPAPAYKHSFSQDIAWALAQADKAAAETKPMEKSCKKKKKNKLLFSTGMACANGK